MSALRPTVDVVGRRRSAPRHRPPHAGRGCRRRRRPSVAPSPRARGCRSPRAGSGTRTRRRRRTATTRCISGTGPSSAHVIAERAHRGLVVDQPARRAREDELVRDVRSRARPARTRRSARARSCAAATVPSQKTYGWSSSPNVWSVRADLLGRRGLEVDAVRHDSDALAWDGAVRGDLLGAELGDRDHDVGSLRGRGEAAAVEPPSASSERLGHGQRRGVVRGDHEGNTVARRDRERRCVHEIDRPDASARARTRAATCQAS